MISAEASAITHGHELGYIPSACFAHIINLVSHTDISLKDAVKDSHIPGRDSSAAPRS